VGQIAQTFGVDWPHLLAQVISSGLPGTTSAEISQIVQETQAVTVAIDEADDLGDITDVQRRKLFADNARRLYGLKG